MPYLARAFRFLQDRKSLKKDLSLPFPVSHLAYRPSVGMLDGGGSWNPNRPMKLMGRRKDYGGETSLLQEPSGQPHGLATKRSGWGKKHGLRPFLFHPHRHRLDSLV